MLTFWYFLSGLRFIICRGKPLSSLLDFTVKIKALKEFVNYIKEISKYIQKKAYLKNRVSNNFIPTIGFSDDDLRNLEKVKKHFENEPENIIKTISTAGGIKKPY